MEEAARVWTQVLFTYRDGGSGCMDIGTYKTH